MNHLLAVHCILILLSPSTLSSYTLLSLSYCLSIPFIPILLYPLQHCQTVSRCCIHSTTNGNPRLSKPLDPSSNTRHTATVDRIRAPNTLLASLLASLVPHYLRKGGTYCTYPTGPSSRRLLHNQSQSTRRQSFITQASPSASSVCLSSIPRSPRPPRCNLPLS